MSKTEEAEALLRDFLEHRKNVKDAKSVLDAALTAYGKAADTLGDLLVPANFLAGQQICIWVTLDGTDQLLVVTKETDLENPHKYKISFKR